MTSRKQPKPEQNGPQPLNDAALDRAAGGSSGCTSVGYLRSADAGGAPDKPVIVGSIPGPTR